MSRRVKRAESPGRGGRTAHLSPRLAVRVLELLGPRRWRKLSFLLALSLLASALEVLGIGIFLPYISIVGDPDSLLGHPTYGPILTSLGITDRNGLILAAGLGLLSVFTLKNAYLAVHWHIVTRWIYAEIERVSSELFEAYLRSPYLFHLTQNSSVMLRNVAGEVKHVFRDVLEHGVRLVVECLVFLGVVGVLIVVSPIAATLGLILMGLLALMIERLTRHRIGRLGAQRAQATAERYRWLQQGLAAIKEIQILGRESYFVRRFDEWETLLTSTMRKAALAGHYPRLALEMAAVVFLVSIVTLPMLAGQDLDQILGTLVVFGVAIIRLLPAVGKVTVGINHVRFSAPSVDIVYEEFRKTRREDGGGPAGVPGPAIQFEEAIVLDLLSYQYPGREEWAIQDLSLTVKRGEAIGFSGESGGGKTTLLHLLTGLLIPTKGRILVDGRDIATNIQSWQRELGYVSQDVYLLDDTVRRNVAFGIADAEVDDAAVWKALEVAQLAQTVREIGKGLDAPVGERGVGLSGGQRQRIAIARALYHDPPVLVLDEPTSALDPETERLLGETIVALGDTKTLLVVSHRSETLQDCDLVYVLGGGRVVERVARVPAQAQQP